ncbi:hypothetical protein FSARC_11697 [Fusarium sarcochroum]|uniref:Secreted protein n=1 Tax=Fusarium sarcochroum TaxID=1208366 RepID=A0A8H4TDV4_9HYPO|nr:hypothetical protein FSARC_11697 [Fusarium sarcochroum]
MRFDIAAIFASLALTTAADRMEVFTKCAVGSCDSRQAVFYTDVGSYKVDASKGCRKTSVPGMTEFCVDWDKRRAHFKFSHQATKRCLTQDSESAYGCDAQSCWKTTWREIGCNWLVAPPGEEEGGELATESETAAVPTASADADADGN